MNQHLSVSVQTVVDVVENVVEMCSQVITLVILHLKLAVEESGWMGMLNILAEDTYVLDSKS